MRLFAPSLLLALSCVCPCADHDSLPIGEFDLLRFIQPERDIVHGEWDCDGKTLLSKVGWEYRVQLPYIPPAEYALEVVVERVEGGGSLNLGLVAGKSQFQMVLDGCPDQGYKYGLHMVDGRHLHSNPTTKAGPLLKNNKASTVLCAVRRRGLSVRLDGKSILEWTGTYDRLSNETSHWSVPNREALFIGCSIAGMRITRLSVTPLSGVGKLLHG